MVRAEAEAEGAQGATELELVDEPVAAVVPFDQEIEHPLARARERIQEREADELGTVDAAAPVHVDLVKSASELLEGDLRVISSLKVVGLALARHGAELVKVECARIVLVRIEELHRVVAHPALKTLLLLAGQPLDLRLEIQDLRLEIQDLRAAARAARRAGRCRTGRGARRRGRRRGRHANETRARHGAACAAALGRRAGLRLSLHRMRPHRLCLPCRLLGGQLLLPTPLATRVQLLHGLRHRRIARRRRRPLPDARKPLCVRQRSSRGALTGGRARRGHGTLVTLEHTRRVAREERGSRRWRARRTRGRLNRLRLRLDHRSLRSMRRRAHLDCVQRPGCEERALGFGGPEANVELALGGANG